jgi:hypothetical protein
MQVFKKIFYMETNGAVDAFYVDKPSTVARWPIFRPQSLKPAGSKNASPT